MERNVDLRNWLKLKVVLNRATDILRKQFLSRWKLHNEGKDWVNSRETGIHFITGLGKDVYDGAKKLQKRALKNGDVNLWDLTTVVLALRTTSSPEPEDNQELKDENEKVQRLLSVRNKLDHHPTKIVTDKEFLAWWEEVSSILVALGDSADELNCLKATENLSGIDTGGVRDTEVENDHNKSLAAKLKIMGEYTAFKWYCNNLWSDKN